MPLGKQKIDRKILKEFLDVFTQLRRMLIEFSKAHQDHDRATTGLQYRGLFLINEHEGITVGELAEKCMMSSAAVAQFIKRLEDGGMIKKISDEVDKRITHLYLTSAGRKEIKKMGKLFTKRIYEFLRLLPEKDIIDLIRIQRNLLAGLEQKKNHDKNT